MKQLSLALLTLCFGIILFSSCKKTEDAVTPPPTPVVVGNWKLDRIIITELPTAYASFNGRALDPLQNFGLQSTYSFLVDNTFTNKETQSGVIEDYKGTWAFTNNQLKITYSDKTTDDFVYDETTKFLNMPPLSVKLPFTNSTTNTTESVACKVQLVYIKI